nr:hypothetical protein BaRGS_013656 [Batillaria attramentaria]
MSADYIKGPTQRQADNSMVKFFNMSGCLRAFACIDGIHVAIEAPHEQENEFVNRKGFHSINVEGLWC